MVPVWENGHDSTAELLAAHVSLLTDAIDVTSEWSWCEVLVE